jgi:hypothetical protein
MSKTGGSDSLWAVQSYFFADDLRKQVLIWRAISAEERSKYVEAARPLIESQHSRGSS